MKCDGTRRPAGTQKEHVDILERIHKAPSFTRLGLENALDESLSVGIEADKMPVSSAHDGVDRLNARGARVELVEVIQDFLLVRDGDIDSEHALGVLECRCQLL